MAYGNSSRQAVLAALSDVVTVSPNPENDTRSTGFSRHAHHPSYDPESSYSGLQPLPISEPPTMVPAKSPFEDRSLPPPPPAKSTGSGMASKFARAFGRQTAEDKKRAKDKRMNDEINKTAAKASRMDIIDRLDLSGINGSSMFHHDSPYDACTPHMNKGKRAPVGAFDPNIDPMTGLPRVAPGAKKGSHAAAHDALASDGSPVDEKGSGRPGTNPNGSRRRSATAPLVPSLSMHAEGSAAELPLDEDLDADRDAETERVWRSRQGYHTQPSNVPDSRYDVSNPNADVWGVSAEPWQDFAQPKQRNRSTLSPYSHNPGDRSGTTSAASSVLDMEAIMTGKKKPSRDQDDLAVGSASPFPEPDWNDRAQAGDAPKRSKSLIKRIRSMRDNPNVPPPEDGVEMGSVRDRRRRAAQHKHSPSTPPLRTDSSGAAMHSSYESRAAAANAATGVSNSSYGRRTGRNVVTPTERDVLGQREDPSYFQQSQLSSSQDSRSARSPATEGGLTRNGSLFNKLRRNGGGQKSSPKSAERQAAYT
ncbi:hypothetical protein NDA16_002167 [Ustilago loliicola]|nr:hypothetical protein NDA16_002167 [Ustilago loliicola]